jgi:hypothetical protein
MATFPALVLDVPSGDFGQTELSSIIESFLAHGDVLSKHFLQG